MDQNTSQELESLRERIRSNSASLLDYERYESILLDNGLSSSQIHANLEAAGLSSWEEFVEARSQKVRGNKVEAGVIGGLLGLGLGLLLVSALSNKD